MMIMDVIRDARAPEPITQILTQIYSHTLALLHLYGRDLPIHRKRGMKEGCPLLPKLFLTYYDVLLRQMLFRHRDARPNVFVDDIAVCATNQAALIDTLNQLHHAAYRMGLRFSVAKTETYHRARN